MPESGNNLTAVVDLNVWLALVYDGHVRHPTAISWFEQGGRESKASALPGEPSRLAFRGLQEHPRFWPFILSLSARRHHLPSDVRPKIGFRSVFPPGLQAEVDFLGRQFLRTRRTDRALMLPCFVAPIDAGDSLAEPEASVNKSGNKPQQSQGRSGTPRYNSPGAAHFTASD
jgi:hypothetical protein